MHSDLDTYRLAQQAPRGLQYGADSRLYVTGVLLDVDDTTNRALVSVNDGAGSWVPMVPGDYSGARVVHVILDPFQGGRAQLVVGPTKTPPPVPDPDPEPLPQPPPKPDVSEFVTRTVTITPSWSGTWRVSRGAWDRWNTNRYGGRSTLYQGSAYGSGELIGLATYGNQIRNLQATEITAARLTLRGAGVPLPSYPGVTVQGSPHGSRPSGAPSSSGASVTSSSISGSRTRFVDLPSSVRSAMRSGDVRGLALVGSGYNAVRGTSAADGMALRITYRRPA